VTGSDARLLLGDRIRRPDDDILVAAAVPDRRDGGLARLDVRGQHEDDIPVVDGVGDRGLADVLDLRVEVLIAQRLDPAVVLIEDEHVVALLGQRFGDGVADAAAAENRVRGS